MIDKKFAFTDERLRNIVPDTGRRMFVFDTKQPGLAIRVTPAGSKSFKFKMWDSKRKRSIEINIGAYPKVSLSSAREIAAQYTKDLTAGIDLIGQSQTVREEPTLDQAFDRWITKKATRGKTSWVTDKLRYDKYIRPSFGTRRVSDITSRQIENWFLSLPKKTGLSTTSANRILVIIKTIFNQELRQYDNPCTGIRLNREESRERFLRPSELPAFFEALTYEETPEYLRDFIYLGLYTGARKGNLLGMKWQDIDLDLGVWVIPAAQSKNRSAMTIPLIDEAKTILDKRWAANQTSKSPSIFVFPAINLNGQTGHMNDIRGSWNALLKRAGIKDFRLHDLRRTLGSYQTIEGASSTIVGKTLGHKSQAATAIYSRLTLDPVRDAIDKAVQAMHKIAAFPSKTVAFPEKDRRSGT